MYTTVSHQNLIDAMKTGRKIEAIKQLRSLTGCGLKEAKDVVEAVMYAFVPAQALTPVSPTYVVLYRNRNEADFTRTYTGASRTYAMEEGQALFDGFEDRDVIVAQTIAQTKKTLVEI